MRKFFSIAGGRRWVPPGGVKGVGSPRNTRRAKAGLKAYESENVSHIPSTYVSGVASISNPSQYVLASSALSSDSYTTTTREKVFRGAHARIFPWDAKWLRRTSITRGWKKGVGNWVSTSVLVQLKGSVAGGESSNVGEEETS